MASLAASRRTLTKLARPLLSRYTTAILPVTFAAASEQVLSAASVSALGEVGGARTMATASPATLVPPGTTTMKAVVSEGKKDSQCAIVDVPLPVLKPREVLVKVAYTALNRADTLQRKGLYPPPKGVTDVLGLEAAGVVAAYGPDCSIAPSSFPLGSRVMALLGGGGNAEYVAVHESHLLPVPEGMDLRTAAAVPETWLTAYQLLFITGQLAKGEVVLIHAAGSGVGTAATQLASNAGADVIAVAGQDSKLEVAKQLGAKSGINYKTTPEFGAVVAELTGGKGVNLILDPVGASFWRENVGAIAMGASYSGISYTPFMAATFFQLGL